eukprot:m.920677 g.920677  ORF g.920677 m.920677 type:complete len:305 (-) comp69198_c0_seq1:189-1103(-)
MGSPSPTLKRRTGPHSPRELPPLSGRLPPADDKLRSDCAVSLMYSSEAQCVCGWHTRAEFATLPGASSPSFASPASSVPTPQAVPAVISPRPRTNKYSFQFPTGPLSEPLADVNHSAAPGTELLELALEGERSPPSDWLVDAPTLGSKAPSHARRLHATAAPHVPVAQHAPAPRAHHLQPLAGISRSPKSSPPVSTSGDASPSSSTRFAPLRLTLPGIELCRVDALRCDAPDEDSGLVPTSAHSHAFLSKGALGPDHPSVTIISPHLDAREDRRATARSRPRADIIPSLGAKQRASSEASLQLD